jgi:hypothetical protein
MAYITRRTSGGSGSARILTGEVAGGDVERVLGCCGTMETLNKPSLLNLKFYLVTEFF